MHMQCQVMDCPRYELYNLGWSLETPPPKAIFLLYGDTEQKTCILCIHDTREKGENSLTLGPGGSQHQA